MPKFTNKVIDYTVYGKIDGALKLLQDTTNCQMPSVENTADTIKGAGILGEINWPTLASPGSMTFSPGFSIDNEDAVALSAPKVQEFEVRWVVEKFDSANIETGVDAHKAVIKGMPKKYDPGKIEKGSTMDGSNDYEVIYYKKIINGNVVLEIDKLNYKFAINGIDYAAQITSAL